MTKIIMHGYSGKMGQVVCGIIKNDSACQLVAGIDAFQKEADFPTFTNINECDVSADAIIDFSTASAVPVLLKYSEEKNIPLVICTTGLTDEMKNQVLAVSKKVAILQSANMSLGVNLLINLVQKATELLADSGFDIEIVEKHHNQKIDAPSGTALAFANAINEKLEPKYNYVYDRSHTKEKRTKNEIGIHAVRGGTIVGEHDIIFAGKDEIIQFNHTALSKEIFAVGAVKAAKFLSGKTAGMYTMKDVIAESI